MLYGEGFRKRTVAKPLDYPDCLIRSKGWIGQRHVVSLPLETGNEPECVRPVNNGPIPYAECGHVVSNRIEAGRQNIYELCLFRSSGESFQAQDSRSRKEIQNTGTVEVWGNDSE